MKKTSRYSISYCICPGYERKFPIPRKGGATREKKHIKTIWCPFCKDMMNMMEIRDVDFYQTADGSILERYQEAEEEKESDYILKEDLMEDAEMYEFDFK